MRLLILIPLFFAGTALAAQPQRTLGKSARPIVNKPAPVQSFDVTCVDVVRLVGGLSSFSFMCRQSDGKVQMYTVAKGEDNTGTYPVGHDPQTGTALSNLYTMTAISQTVAAFAGVKAANPKSSAVLELQGIMSKLPAANGAPVVTAATLFLS